MRRQFTYQLEAVPTGIVPLTRINYSGQWMPLNLDGFPGFMVGGIVDRDDRTGVVVVLLEVACQWGKHQFDFQMLHGPGAHSAKISAVLSTSGMNLVLTDQIDGGPIAIQVRCMDGAVNVITKNASVRLSA